MRKPIFICIIIFQASCFDFSKSQFFNLGDGFEYGFYNNSIDLLNIYYHSGGIFPYQCTYVRWNKDFIYVECKEKDGNETYHYIIDKQKYKLQPRQFESNGIIGPVNYDSLAGTSFFKDAQMFKNIRTIEDVK